MQLVPVDPEIVFAQAKWDALTHRERGARILAAMAAGKINKTELAELLHLSYPSVHAWIVGEAFCDWARWMAVVTAVGLKQTWIPPQALLDQGLREVDALRPPSSAPKKKRARP